jgi:hypothetical protein
MSRIDTIGNIARTNLEARNIYTPDNVYEINSSAVEKIVNSIANTFFQGNSFDITNTLIGRTFGPNTPITTIGNQALAKQWFYNIESNAATEIASSINVSALLKGDLSGFLKRKDWHITIDQNGNSFLGQALHAVKTGVGFQDTINPFTKNTDETFQIAHTGKQQVQTLVRLLQQNIGSTDYSNSNNVDLQNLSKNQKTNLTLKTFFPGNDVDPRADIGPNGLLANSAMITSKEVEIDNIVDETIRVKGVDKINGLGFGKTSIDHDTDKFPLGNEVPKQDIVWGVTSDSDLISKFGVKRGILWYTQQLLKSRKNPETHQLNQDTILFTDADGNKSWKGSTECTSYTQAKPYDQYDPGSITDPYPKIFRYIGNKQFIGANQMSTINETVMPTIIPIKKIDKRRLMFSFENLAWTKSEILRLPECEQGDFGGRLMWFAPYDLQISENTTVELDSHKFIGRSEPLYTYNGSERSASISFKLIIDHSRIPKGYQNTKEDIAAWFYGCDPKNGSAVIDPIVVNNISNISKDQLQVQKVVTKPTSSEVKVEINPAYNLTTIYFDNNITNIDQRYEVQGGRTIPVNGQFGLNIDFFENSGIFLGQIKLKIDESSNFKNPLYDIEFIGAASKLNGTTYNQSLGDLRATELQNYINIKMIETYGSQYSLTKSFGKVSVKTLGSTRASDIGSSANNINTIEAKLDRYATINITTSTVPSQPKDDSNNVKETPEETKVKQNTIDQNNAIQIGLKAKTDDDLLNCEDFTMDILAPKFLTGFDKRKFFVPAFHSYSAYDMHKRLTFLNQCTKQGTTLDVINTTGSTNTIPKNSIFGRMPVLVMRIGDFFHTKVLIESLSMDYSETTWDMNPEGHGMQPMMVNITLQLKVLGGQSLQAPIDALNNALSFNFYPNSTYPNENMDMYGNSSTITENGVSRYKSAIDVENEQLAFLGIKR